MHEAGPENRRRAEEIVARAQEISRELAQTGHDPDLHGPDLVDELLALTRELTARVNLESCMSNLRPQKGESQPPQPIPWELVASAMAFLPFAVFFGRRGDALGQAITVIGAVAILCYAVYVLRPR